MEACAHCGEPILAHQPSFYAKAPGQDIGRTYHTCCDPDPWGVKAAVAAERERCAKVIDDMDNPSVSGRSAYKRHHRTREMLKNLAAAIRKGP